MDAPDSEARQVDALLELLGQILEVDPESLTEETTYSDVAKWDSLRNIIIANALEQAYGARISDVDMTLLTSIRGVRSLLRRSGSDKPTQKTSARVENLRKAASLERLRAAAARDLALSEIYELAEILRTSPLRSGWTGATARIAVSGAVVTDFIAAAVAAGAFQEGVLADVRQTPYGAMAQEILNVSSDLYKFGPEYVVLVPDWRDWIGAFAPDAGPEEIERHLAEGVRQFVSLWDLLIANARCKIFQHVLTPPHCDLRGLAERSLAASAAAQVRRLNELLFTAGRGKVEWIELDRLAAAKGPNAFAGARHYFASRLPFDNKYLPDYVFYFRAAWRRATYKPKKVLALDLDNTLWGGAIGDDGAEGIRLGAGSAAGEAYAAWGSYIRELGARGVILAICSKNDPQLAGEGLNHPHAALRREDFAAAQISWDDKATGLRRLADELNVGLESFVFVDDNPFECDLVREHLPEVAVVALGEEPADFVDLLESGRWFDLSSYSREDFTRAHAYPARGAAEAERRSATDVDSYLRGLEMVGKLFPPQAAHLPRLAQMEQKTNQFNTMTRRYSEAEIKRFMEGADSLALAFELRDRHADHGLVSSLMCVFADDVLRIENWLMSCRVFSRTAEDYIMNELVALAARRRAKTIAGVYAATQRNGVVADLFARLGFISTEFGEWRLDVADAARRPLKTFVRSPAMPEETTKGPEPASSVPREPHEILQVIAAAEAAEQRQDLAEAAARWREVADLDPDDAHARIKTIEILRALRRFEEADAYAAAQLLRFPENPGIAFQFASNAAVADQWEDALARWRQAAGKFPDLPEPLFGMAEALVQLGRSQEAEPLLIGNAGRFPDHVWSAMLLAELLGRRGDWAEAARRLEDLGERFPDRPEIGVRCCIALVNAGEVAAARRVIDGYGRRFPQELMVRDHQIWCANCAQDWSAALDGADALVAAGSASPQTVGLARRAREGLKQAAAASLVIYGNCQADVLAGLVSRLKRLYPQFDIVTLLGHIPEEIEKASDPRLKNAAICWEQFDERPEAPVRDALRQALPAGVPTLRYPSLSLFSLWPFNWPDPRSRPEPPRFPHGRYPYEGDSIGQAVAKEGLRGEPAYQRYLELSRAKLGDLQRLLDRDVAQLRKRDGQCDVKMTDYVLDNYRRGPMFYSWGHVSGSAMAEIARQLLRLSRATLGGDEADDRAQLERLHTAIEPLWMPIHPDVARWHRLEYCRDENAKFHVHGNWWTFKEFIIKYIEYDVSW